MSEFKERDQVTLRGTGIPQLDGQPAEVLMLTDYGAHVITSVGSGAFRALFAEMEPRQAPRPSGDVCDNCGGPHMIRAGACLTCADCGTSGGCG